MLPRLGKRFDIDITVISKPRHEFQSLDHDALGLPRAPAVMIGDRVIVAGADISEEQLAAAIGLQLAEAGDGQP
ncbi:MAG: hypothetical protein L3J03_03915 [Desulfobacterales bacterium]|nr:hypothetical protein [Desulfobacterales bacterium]